MSAHYEQEARFIARLPHIRTFRGMTQQALADAAGMQRASLGMVEIGRRGVRLGEAAALCDALDVPLADALAAGPLRLTVETRID